MSVDTLQAQHIARRLWRRKKSFTMMHKNSCSILRIRLCIRVCRIFCLLSARRYWLKNLRLRDYKRKRQTGGFFSTIRKVLWKNVLKSYGTTGMHWQLTALSMWNLMVRNIMHREIFDSAEFVANLDKNAVAVNRSVYDHVIYDSSTVEKLNLIQSRLFDVLWLWAVWERLCICKSWKNQIFVRQG